MAIGEVPAGRWPVEYSKGPRAIGPDRDGHCPCGSNMRFSSCHARRDGTWAIPEKRPLISGRRTGYANSACYAKASKDCGERVSREHWISASILRSIPQAPFKIRGLQWQRDIETNVSVKGMQAKVLCERHNSALSALDSEAGEMFRIIQHYQRVLESEKND